ncbi:hypothetical protein ACTMVF_22190 [Streptomyces sp. SD31]
MAGRPGTPTDYWISNLPATAPAAVHACTAERSVPVVPMRTA